MFHRLSFFYDKNRLSLNTKGSKIPLITYTQGVDRPIYLYSLQTVKRRVEAYKTAFKKFKNRIYYAVKANPNLELMSFIKKQGFGADVVSIREFNRALESGFNSDEIIFSGVGKTKTEIKEALEKNIFQINCESISEITRVFKIARSLNKKVAIGIRLNPDITVDTHPYISTGLRENKFGIPLEQLSLVLKALKSSKEFVRLQGISCHIGSQIMNTDPLVKALESILRVKKELSLKGYEIKYLNLGGGLGVDYHSNNEEDDIKSITEFGEKITPLFKDFKGEVLFEPGRSIVARAGVLLARVEYIKNNGFKDFIILNTGMHHLIRPSLYSAYHNIVPLKFDKTRTVKNFDVAGPVCESSDIIGYDRALQVPKEGEWIAIMDTGAYGMSMASAYNLHAFPKEILV